MVTTLWLKQPMCFCSIYRTVLTRKIQQKNAYHLIKVSATHVVFQHITCGFTMQWQSYIETWVSHTAAFEWLATYILTVHDKFSHGRTICDNQTRVSLLFVLPCMMCYVCMSVQKWCRDETTKFTGKMGCYALHPWGTMPSQAFFFFFFEVFK